MQRLKHKPLYDTRIHYATSLAEQNRFEEPVGKCFAAIMPAASTHSRLFLPAPHWQLLILVFVVTGILNVLRTKQPPSNWVLLSCVKLLITADHFHVPFELFLSPIIPRFSDGFCTCSVCTVSLKRQLVR